MKLDIPENIENIKPYPPGKPLDELEREYGITDSIKLASNENPWGASPKAIKAIGESLGDMQRYPDGSAYYLTEAIAKYAGVGMSEIILGNGSNEVIEFLVKAFVQDDSEVITSHPSFLMYQKFVQVRGGVNRVIPLKDMHHDLQTILDTVNEKTRLIFIDNPNNPTGTYLEPELLIDFINSLPEHVILVLDEAYVDFMDLDKWLDVPSLIKNQAGRCGIVSLRTFSKAYGLSGLRVGFGLMAEEIVTCLHKVRQPFNVNSLAQVGALAALGDVDFYEQTLLKNRQGMKWLMKEIKGLGCEPFASQTNFFLIDVQGNADKLYTEMLYKGVIIRSMSAYGYPHYIRVTVGTTVENKRFLKALSDCLKELNYV
ncbi:histidinol-phosphate transaminase [Desulfotalea psychrophila]|uniref:histidinol-phosphate transaminase n=1 Tax=Desulfotalea psychrophila TaxID=84980 RepID=UPI00030DC43F|nr:histidinol-phosphate transaminase [Desulfotalea psychrophila]